MQWYYVRDQQSVGPVEEAELERLARAGEILPTTLVWNESLGSQWVQASTVPNLVFGAPPPLPAPTFESEFRGEYSPSGETPNHKLREMARESLRGNWGLAIGAILLQFAIGFAAGLIPFAGALASWIIAGPFSVGMCLIFLSFARRKDASIDQLFGGFKIFGTALGAYLLVVIFTILWTLLLIIPGIIAAFSYAMTFFILADSPETGPMEAITQSKEMMRGRKWKLFCLSLSFIGWAILCLFTCGIGFLWLTPYIQTSIAHFYEDIRLSRAGATQA